MWVLICPIFLIYRLRNRNPEIQNGSSTLTQQLGEELGIEPASLFSWCKTLYTIRKLNFWGTLREAKFLTLEKKRMYISHLATVGEFKLPEGHARTPGKELPFTCWFMFAVQREQCPVFALRQTHGEKCSKKRPQDFPSLLPPFPLYTKP